MNNGIFGIYGNDLKKVEEFIDKHKNSCWDKYHDVSGALISYTFVPTGITNIAIIKCECGKKLIVSNEVDCGFSIRGSKK